MVPSLTGIRGLAAVWVLLFHLAFRRGPIDRALSAPFVQFLGRISFPLYLLHAMPLLWLGYHLHSSHAATVVSIAALLLYVALSIGLAALLHVAIERPSHRWGRRWARSGQQERGRFDLLPVPPDTSFIRQASG